MTDSLRIQTVSETSTTDIKADAHRLIDSLPPNATWDDIMHGIYVRQSIEAGLDDSKAGRVEPVASVRERFGLRP